jgi:CheY-like chemotaxis protein
MKNVLLVDDDPTSNFISTRILEKIGVKEIQTALSGMGAINLLKDYYLKMNYSPDIILLDLEMPIMGGFGFLSIFEKLDLPQKEKIKIVIVTSSDDSLDLRLAEKFGVSDYISKPLTEKSLRSVLK